jgi:hypothetical protein
MYREILRKEERGRNGDKFKRVGGVKDRDEISGVPQVVSQIEEHKFHLNREELFWKKEGKTGKGAKCNKRNSIFEY